MSRPLDGQYAPMKLVSVPFDVLNTSSNLLEHSYDHEHGSPLYSNDRAQAHVVPTNHPHVPDLEAVELQSSLASGCYIDHDQGLGLIIGRTPPSTSSTLEVRYLPLSPSQISPNAHHFLFPAPLLPEVSLVLTSDRTKLVIQVCTITAHLFRIQLPVNLLLASPSSASVVLDIPQRWVQEQKLSFLGSEVYSKAATNLLTASHSSADLRIHLAACSDGRVMKAVWEDLARDDGNDTLEGAWQESLMRLGNFLFGVSRFFGRTTIASPGSKKITASEKGTSSTHVLSLDTFIRSSLSSEDTLAFTVSRDRKLRIWHMGTDACIRTTDLPSTMAESQRNETDMDLMVVNEQQRQEASDLIDPVVFSYLAHPLIRAFSAAEYDGSGPYPLYLIVLVPGSSITGPFFALYGAQFEGGSRQGVSRSNAALLGDLGDLDLLWEKEVDDEVRNIAAELRDVAIVPQRISKSGTQDGKGAAVKWTLWTLWYADGKTLIKHAPISYFEGEANTAEGEGDAKKDVRQTWQSVSTQTVFSALHGPEMDEELNAQVEPSQAREDIASFFLTRILEPGRYSGSTLDQALRNHEEDLNAKWASSLSDKPSVLLENASFASISEHMAKLVGCDATLQLDESSGAQRYDLYISALRREWTHFVGILDEVEASNRWPISFIKGVNLGENREDVPFVVATGRIGLASPEDGSYLLQRFASALAPSRLETAAALATTATQASRSRFAQQRAAVEKQREELIQANLTSTFDTLGANAQALENALQLATFAFWLKRLFSPGTLRTFEVGLYDSMTTQDDIPLEALAFDAWSTTLQSSLGEDELAEVQLRFTELCDSCGLHGEQGVEALAALVDTLTEDIPVSESSIGHSLLWTRTELGAGLASEAFTQALLSRISLARSLAVLIAAIVSGVLPMGLLYEADLASRTLNALHCLNALYNVASAEGIAERTAEEVPLLEDGPTDTDAVARRIDRLRFDTDDGSKGAIPGTPQNFFHACILAGVLEPQDKGVIEPLSRAVSSFAARIFGSFGLIDDGSSERPSPALRRPLVTLAHRAVIMGYPTVAAKLVMSFSSAPSGSYILARSMIALDEEANEAARHFDKVSAALMSLDVLASPEGTDLLSILPPSVAEPSEGTSAEHVLVHFYRHASLYMAKLPSHLHVARYAKLAVQTVKLISDDPPARNVEFSKGILRDLWFTIFRARLTMNDFEGSYDAVSEMPDETAFRELKRDSLRTLIGIMCERGSISEMLSMNFASNQEEVERTLSFKARNSDPRSNPNYYRILYAFHVRRGDLKSASCVMYQQAMRLADLQSKTAVARYGLTTRKAVNAVPLSDDDLLELANFEARAYLAAINVLALIEPRDAWFAYELSSPPINLATDDDDDAAGEGNSKQRREITSRTGLTSYIPNNQFAQGTNEMQIVRLGDLRRLYRLSLARLELLQVYPDVALSSLDGPNAVLLFTRVDDFDAALSLADELRCDKSSALSSLVDRCVALARVRDVQKRRLRTDPGQEHPSIAAWKDDRDFDVLAAYQGGVGQGKNEEEEGEEDALVGAEARFLDQSAWSASWTGPPSTRAWRYLKLHLEMACGVQEGVHGTVPDESKYRIVVLDRILALGAWDLTPIWLVDWFREYRPDVLIRTLSAKGLLDHALDEAIKLVRLSTDQALGIGSAMKRRKRYAGETTLPYLVLDGLLARAETSSRSSEEGSQEGAYMKRRKKVEELKKIIKDRLEKLHESERNWRNEVDRDQSRSRKSTAMER